MKKFSADLVFTLDGKPLRNGMVITNDEGVITEIRSSPDDDCEILQGIIAPGFVNAHCHLELSHMKGKITEGKGMAVFISEFVSLRRNGNNENSEAIRIAENEMIRNGIVAAGDISNNDSTFSQKKENNMLYHTFIEVFDIVPSRAEEVILNGKRLLNNCPQNASLSPHAPYTVSNPLWKLFEEYSQSTRAILSLHNQESLAESELFISKSGTLADMYSGMENVMEQFEASGKNSLRTVLPKISKQSRLLLVHNTFTSKEDLEWANEIHPDLYWCLCPKANWYIERSLPDFNIFDRPGVKTVIGTDSLASNDTLSVLEELKMINAHYDISTETLLQWACRNGAELFRFESLGTITKGKKPGLNLITNTEEHKITDKSKVIKLI